MFKSDNFGLSSKAAKKSSGNENNEEEEDDEDEDYTYEYIDEDEEEISNAEFSNDETLNKKNKENEFKETNKNKNDTKNNTKIEEESNKATNSKNDSNKISKTEKINQQKDLKIENTNSKKFQRQESESPVRRKKTNIKDEKISQTTTDLKQKKIRSKSVVIDENLNTINNDSNIKLTEIKNASSTEQIKKKSTSALNSRSTTPIERVSRTKIPLRLFNAAKSIWEARTSSNPPPTTRVNEAINKDPWLRAASRAAEFKQTARATSIESTSKRSTVRFSSIPTEKKNEHTETIKSPQTAREKILAEMKKNAHIAAKPTFAVAGVKPKPKPPPPPPPPPPSKFLETKLNEKPDLMETSAAKIPIPPLRPINKNIETKKVEPKPKTQTQKENLKTDEKSTNKSIKKESIKKEDENQKPKKVNEEKTNQSDKSKSNVENDVNDEEEFNDEEWEYEDEEEGDLDNNKETKDIEEKVKNKKKKLKKKKKRKKIVKIRKKLKKKKPKTEVKEIKIIKRKWILPPRPPPEIYLMPPNEKRIYQINKEDSLRPVKRYAKRAKKEITIPFVIPWEQTATLNGQGGMGAFGTHRDPKINIEDGNVKLIQGELKSETILPLFEENRKKFASQKGLTSFGSHRKNVDNIIDGHVYESSSKQNLCESVIPRTMLGSLTDQSNMTPFGSLRTQELKIEYSKGMTKGFAPESNTFLSRQFLPNQLEPAGSHIIDCRRQIVQKGQPLKASQISESIVPKIFSNNMISTRSGVEFGAFRPLIHESTGGYKMSYDEERLCKLVIPYQTAPSLK